MSDAVTHTEIEDVLTSIRRLVSDTGPADTHRTEPLRVANTAQGLQDAGPQDAAEQSAAASENTATDQEMTLLLTPALRVSEGREEAVVEGLAADEAAMGHSAGAPVSETEQDFAFEGGVQEAFSGPDGAPEVDAVETESFLPEGGITDSALDAGLAAALADDIVDDAPADDDSSSDEDVAAEAVDPDELEEAPFDFKQVLEARIRECQELEDTAAAEAVDVASEASEEKPAEAGLVASVMADLGQSVQEDVLQTVAPAQGAAPETTLSEAAGEFDEAMLREMVADIVRQELQGALGERITRNVRKLVRREIHRALAAHDLS
jgi:cell pole-organizing protein PopZ